MRADAAGSGVAGADAAAAGVPLTALEPREPLFELHPAAGPGCGGSTLLVESRVEALLEPRPAGLVPLGERVGEARGLPH